MAVYGRVSSQSQSTEMQLRDLLDYARRREWQVWHTYSETASGADPDRRQLRELLADAKQRHFDVVLVWKFDRLARSVRQLTEIAETLRALRIELVSFTEGIDTTTPGGEMVFHVLGAVAQLERSLIRERVRAGLANARAKGKRLGRPRRPLPEFGGLVDPAARQRVGLTLRKMAAQFHCSVSTIKAALAAERIAAIDFTAK